jgi:hypothetical protein
VYVLVRTDIPLVDQVVQVGHVCFEAGKRFDQVETPCHLVLLGVPSERHLHAIVSDCAAVGVRSVVFWEPDDGMGYTAACTEPVTAVQRRLFRRLPLWSPILPAAPQRGPPAMCHP